MNSPEAQSELVLRYLDGRLTSEERARVTDLLRTDPSAREFLRSVAEHAVLVADLERIAVGRAEQLHPRPVRSPVPGSPIVRVPFRVGSWGWAMAAGIALLAGLAWLFLPKAQTGTVRISKVTGSSQYLGANGRIETVFAAGTFLGLGDTLETRSCDAWIDLELSDASILTIAGHTTLRVLDAESGEKRFKLSEGTLWVSPSRRPGQERLVIQTPMATVAAQQAQFDLSTSSSEMVLRVNQGSARVTQTLDGSVAEVPADHQVSLTLDRKGPLAVRPQPKPINYWACDLWQVPEVILGRWLPPMGNERARLGAEPLLWPGPERGSIMLYAVALAAWKSTAQPVLLQADSKLRFRGRTERSQTVRFGFSAQKMRGAFAGKFEVDVTAASLGPVGETWEVELSLRDFRPLHPQLSSSPEGLELTDVYALTVQVDAGLELNHIELIPGKLMPTP